MQTDSKQPPVWRVAPIQQWLLLLLLGAVALLLVEIRFEHQSVLADQWQAWIPLAYLAFMVFAIPMGLRIHWKFGRKILAGVFGALAVVGLCGFWFHGKGKPLPAIKRIVTTVLSQPGQLLQIAADEDFSAPLLAPLSLVGLGVMGILISLWNHNQPQPAELKTRRNEKDTL